MEFITDRNTEEIEKVVVAEADADSVLYLFSCAAWRFALQ